VIEQDLADARRTQLDQRRQHGGNHALIAVV